MPRALWVRPGESLPLVCRSAGFCLLCPHPVGPAGRGHEVGSGWAGSEMGLASGGGVRRGGTAPTGRGRRVWASGSGGDIHLGTRLAGAFLLGVAEWSLGIWRAVVKSQPIPRPLGSEDKGSWRQADVEAGWLCPHSVNQLLVPSSFPPCVWKHIQTALLLASAGPVYFPSGCCWLDHRMALASGCEQAR